MKDFLGNELSIGDRVVAVSHRRTSSTLYEGTITKLTPKMVEVETKGSEDDWRYEEKMMVSSYKVVKIDS